MSLHCGLSGTASEDRSELPQPASYIFQFEYSEYVFYGGCSPLFVVWKFSSANKLAQPPLVIDYCVFLPGNIHTRRDRTENLEKHKEEIKIALAGN